MRRIGEYLRVKQMETPPTRKTSIWKVISNYDDELGFISWYPAWRQYTFHTAPGTIFNKGCMEDLCAFLDEVNTAQKKAAKERRAQAET